VSYLWAVPAIAAGAYYFIALLAAIVVAAAVLSPEPHASTGTEDSAQSA